MADAQQCLEFLTEIRALRLSQESLQKQMELMAQEIAALRRDMRNLEDKQLIEETWRSASLKTLAYVGSAVVFLSGVIAALMEGGMSTIKRLIAFFTT